MPLLLLLLTLAQHPAHPPHPPRATPPASDEAKLDDVARVHGEAGPWAVAGYRMGLAALAKLSLLPQSHALRVVHRSPKTPQFACVADGAQAATGASVGKLNLALEEASAEAMETTFTNTITGVSVTLRPSARFRARFTNTPREQARALGRAVLSLPDAEVFEQVTARDGGR